MHIPVISPSCHVLLGEGGKPTICDNSSARAVIDCTFGLKAARPWQSPSWGHRPPSWMHTWHNFHLNLLLHPSPQSSWARPEQATSSLKSILQGSLSQGNFFIFLLAEEFKAASQRKKPTCLTSSGESSVLAELPLTQHISYWEEHPWSTAVSLGGRMRDLNYRLEVLSLSPVS